MTGTEIVRVDPRDEAQLRAWWEVGRAATADRPVHAWPVWEISRSALPMARTDIRLHLLAARDEAGAVVGSALVVHFRQDNRHLGEVDVYVLPGHRRRGTGRALLAEAEALTRADGRDTLISSAYAPVGEETAGLLFARATGFELASAEDTKVVDLTAAPPGWADLEVEAKAALGDYRVELHEERVPDRHVDDFCALLGRFLGEVPLGDLDLEEASWNRERLREAEERAVAVGRWQVIAVAVAPDGHLCGYSDLHLNRHDPRHASVGGTLVLPGHRGHRLGLAMKLATHRRLVERYPDCAYVETGNAGVNAHMNAVNDRLGYRVVERCLDVQKRL